MKRFLSLFSLITACLFAGFVPRLAEAGNARPALKVLIVDGQNNHNWKGTTPVMQAILEEAGIFTVDVATTPANLAEFRPDFKKYDVILSNYNGGDWPVETRKAFVDFIRSGGGLVVVHAADNSFPKWKEYNEMTAIGGWGGRDEKSGPMVYWQNGKVVLDPSPGRGGTHGPQHAYQLITREPSHPILAGLPETWLHARDELYSKMRGPARNMTILATAYADPKKGGTGRHEPALLTIRYGQGRIFHTILGHDVPQMKCMGFVFTLQRGTEWAATGKVTLTEVPGNFPTADRVRLWLPDAAYESIKTYDFGKSRKDLAAIEEKCRGASPAALRAIEAKLLRALLASETRYAGKQYVLRLLRRIGSAQCVPAVSRLLTDEKLSHMARFALQQLPCPEATAALLGALKSCRGNLRAGVIGSLGLRGDPTVAGELIPYLSDENPVVAKTTIQAVGRLGGLEVDRTLKRLQVGAYRQAWNKALLSSGDALLRKGDTAAAADIYRVLAADRRNRSLVRLAAYRGLFLTESTKTVPAILALLGVEDPVLSQGARQLISTTPGTEVTIALAGRLSSLAPTDQVTVLDALVARGDRIASPAVLEAAKSKNSQVRSAAVEALGTLGDARVVDLLAKRTLVDGEEGKAAFRSLTSVGGDGVVAAIVQRVDLAPTEIRLRAIEALVVRHETAALPTLVGTARDKNASVRGAAIKALGALAGLTELSTITRMLIECDNAEDRTGLGRAVQSIAKRVEDKDAASRVIAMALPRADSSVKTDLLGVLPVLSSESGLLAVRQEVRSRDPKVSRAAVQSLADWRDPAPLEDLLGLAKTGRDPEKTAAALTGYIRLVSLPANRPSLATVNLLEEALTLTRDVAVQKRILSRLPEFPCKEALTLAEAYSSSATLGETARGAAGAIKSIFLKSGMIATASHNSGATKSAFDGNQNTRWSTNTPMRPGMWFMVDLGLEQKVKKILLDTRNSPGDYPRGSEVYVSHDGKSWGKPVLTSKPQRPITRLNFPKPVRARFIKIVQTGKTDGLFWSIHNIRIDVE